MKKVAVGQVGMSGTPTFVTSATFTTFATSVTFATIATFIYGWHRGTTSTGRGVLDVALLPPVEKTHQGYRGSTSTGDENITLTPCL